MTLVAGEKPLLRPGKQGTPVRIRDGPAAVFGRFFFQGDREGEQGGRIRAIASAGPREGSRGEKACGCRSP